MAVTLMPFVRLPKSRTSARVKQALKEMENTVKVMCLLFVELLAKAIGMSGQITQSGCLATHSDTC